MLAKSKKQKNISMFTRTLAVVIAVVFLTIPTLAATFQATVLKIIDGDTVWVKHNGIPKELAHPHILRHTRAIELLRAGVPVTVVQDLLGHSALTTTAVYLRISNA